MSTFEAVSAHDVPETTRPPTARTARPSGQLGSGLILVQRGLLRLRDPVWLTEGLFRQFKPDRFAVRDQSKSLLAVLYGPAPPFQRVDEQTKQVTDPVSFPLPTWAQ